MEIKLTKKQLAFINAQAFEVLFGGAAGGGKSHGQLLDAFLYAMKYPKSKQILFRRTFPELEKSIIRTALDIYPRKVCTYNASTHCMKFKNGSVLDFGYLDRAMDVYKYQSAEYDVIRFDELTHFTEEMYTYMMSRIRSGQNDYPKAIKSSTNPGGVGHYWVKERFIDTVSPNTLYETDSGGRIFVPSFVTDNLFLMEKDPDYIKRLENLSEKEKKALLYGEWDIFDGQYFTEWNRAVHVIRPFPIPSGWKRYRVLDYGLDMLACYFVAVSEDQTAYVYKEIYESGLIISEAAKRILEYTSPDENIYCTIAPPDLWNRRQDTGKSAAALFLENGVPLTKTRNDRVQGWWAMKEKLKVFTDEFCQPSSKLKIFDCCPNLCRTLPALQYDAKNPNDVATEPHELTHAPDAIRYFCAFPFETAFAEPVEDMAAMELAEFGV